MSPTRSILDAQKRSYLFITADTVERTIRDDVDILFMDVHMPVRDGL